MVGGFVEPQDRLGLAAGPRLGGREQNPRELDTPALATGQGLQCLRENAIREPEVRADSRGFTFRSVAAERGEALFQPAVAVDRLVPLGVVDEFRHRGLRLFHIAQQGVEAAGGQHPILRGDREIALTRILWQVTEFTGPADLSAVRLTLPCQHFQRRGLAGTVPPDEPDAVALLDAEGGVGKQDARAGAQL
jgi:hypothetical protein